MADTDDLIAFARRCIDAFEAEVTRLKALDDPLERARQAGDSFGRQWVKVLYGDG